MTNSDYWLARWLDDHDIRDQRDAKRFLKDQKHIDDLLATVSSIRPNIDPINGADGTTIVAGKTIDLSGDLGCHHPDCLQKDVDKLFRRAWHYFDLIAVEGLTPARAQALLTSQPPDSPEGFLGYIENLFYIRSIGAEDMLIYRQKPHACADHLREYAEKFDATNILEEREVWIASFSANARIVQLKKHDDHWHYTLNHPSLEHTAWGVVASRKARKPDESYVCGAVFDTYAAGLVSDIGAARLMRSPLGAATTVHEELLTEAPGRAPTVQDALFNLDLPVVSELPAKDLIKLRQENWQYFDSFRQALRAGASELVSKAAAGETSSTDIARQIKNDLIEPELIRIRRELRISADLLTRKASISLPVGSLATTVGLLDKSPLVAIGFGAFVSAASIGTLLNDYKKYVDDRRGVMMSDMYFLWDAQRVAYRRSKHRRKV
jgi:hypothetical protein